MIKQIQRWWRPLVASALLVTTLPVAAKDKPSNVGSVAGSPVLFPHRTGELTPKEMDMAKVAWRFFENNYQAKTGLVNAVDGYPSTTMWDTASYMAGMLAAYQLGIIDKHTLDERVTLLLQTMNNMVLFRDEMPNKAYNTITGEKVNYANKPGEIGFSAIDMGRMLLWLKIFKERFPEHSNAIDNVVLRWDFSHIIEKCGTLNGAILSPDNKTQYVQEGRLGYEEYTSKGFKAWGFSTCLASRAEPYAMIPMYCVDVPYDIRDPRELSQHNYVVSESYVLDGLEMDWDLVQDHTSSDKEHTDKVAEDFAQRVYQVQENRYKATGIITARSEHQLDQAPYFVYDTIYSDGYPWNTITDSGKYVPQFAAVALKAALGMWALWKSDYTDLLADHIWNQFVPEKGYYEGVYENGKGPIRTFTANNNGIMLEALLFKYQGKILKYNTSEPLYKGVPPSLWDRTLADPFEGSNRAKNRPQVTTDEGPFRAKQSVIITNKRACPFPLSGQATSTCPVCPVCPVCQDDAPVTLPAWSSCH